MIGNVPVINVLVREWPYDYVVKDSDNRYQVILCRSLFEKFDKESR